MRKKDKRIMRIANEGLMEIEPTIQPDPGSSISVV